MVVLVQRRRIEEELMCLADDPGRISRGNMFERCTNTMTDDVGEVHQTRRK